MPIEISHSDEISRCIIYDRAFSEGIHVNALLWRFDATGADGASHESAVLRRLAKSEDDVHRIGCNIAAEQNSRKNEPPPGKTRRYYCGFRTAMYGSLPQEGDGYQISITHSPEDGEEAHVDIALTISVQGRSARATRRTDAGLALAEQFGAPIPFRCDCDLNDDQHPIMIFGSNCLTAGLPERPPSLKCGDYEVSNDAIEGLPE